MDQNQLLTVVSVVATETIKDRSKDIYDDGLRPAAKEAGEALQSIVGLFNNVVLYPVKKQISRLSIS